MTSELTQLGPYQVLQLLGEGSGGKVYLGEHQILGVKHALKVLRPELGQHQSFVDRFIREASLTARLDHPHIVRVINADQDKGHLYLVMEYVPCKSLDRLMGARPLAPHYAVRLVWQLLHALEHAHQMGVVHRDVKPENILVTRELNAYLTDFGLVGLMSDWAPGGKRLTLAQTPMGTPCFMSPEQWSDDALDPRTDVYGMGATLFHILSMGFPYAGELPLEIRDAQRRQELVSLQALRPQLDPELADIVHQALALDPDRRFASAADFAEALAQWWWRHPHKKLSLGEPDTRAPISGANQPPSHHLFKVKPRSAGSSPSSPLETPTAPLQTPAHGAVQASARSLATSSPQGPRAPLPIVTPPRGAVSATVQAQASLARAPKPRLRPQAAPSTMEPTMPEAQDNSILLRPVSIAPQTYWVGRREPGSVFFANPYLRIFEGEDKNGQRRSYSVLIDPGSSSDFAVVRSKVERVIGKLDNLSMIFVNHQDPDVVSSCTTLSNRFARRALIMTSQETWRLIVHGNLPKDRSVFTDRYPTGFQVLPGQVMIPVPSPFCHFVGAVMLYDPQTRVLFSGDLFGGLTSSDARGFLAEESDWVGIRAFHQLYMPSNAAIRRAIATIRQLDPPVEMIAPQHGRILRGQLMHDFMERLEQLPVGIDNLDERLSSPETLPAWNAVMERVVRTALSVAGLSSLQALLHDRMLKTDLSVDLKAGSVQIKHLGKSTLERAVDVMCHALSDDMGNIIKYEAILAAEEMELPVPRITLEEIDENHVGAEIPLDMAQQSLIGHDRF